MKNRHTAKSAISTILIWAVLIFFLVITIYPVIWMIFGSLKDTSTFYLNIWGFPSDPVWKNYIGAWQYGDLGTKYLNTIIVTGVFLLILLPVNCCAAYTIARMNFRFKKAIYTFLLIGLMIPGGVLGMPTYSVALKLGLVNNLIGLSIVLAGQAISFGVFLLRAFFVSLPKSLEEAALIDGCNRFSAFAKIILPLIKPAIMIQIVFSGLNTWNEYFLSNLMLRTDALKTLPLGVIKFIGEYSTDYPQMFAALTISTLPMIIVYILAQKQFITGLTAGATKG